MTRRTKGIKIEGLAVVRHTGTSCVGGMVWESPRVVFEVGGVEYVWHADSVPESVLGGLEINESVFLEAFAYGDRLRRVRVSKG